MNLFLRLRSRSRLVTGILLSASVLLIAACQPIVDPALMEAEQPATEESESAAEPTFEVEPAKATINASSLRVRQGPSDAYELVTGVKQGETYGVLSMTSDGAWIQLAVDRSPDGQGWVSTEFVTLEGDITNIATVEPEETAETETEASDSEQLVAVGEALIQTPLALRVRSAPTTEEENKIGSVYNDEIWEILEVSEDGLWLKLDVPHLSEDGGWISAEYATLGGDIAGIPTTEVEEPEAADETDTDDADDADADADDADMDDADADDADMDEADADEADMDEADADAADTDEADADAADTDEADADEADMDEADMDEADADEADTDEADTDEADMDEADADEADTDDADADEEAASPTELSAGMMALIQTPLALRVRSAPTTEEENKIGSVYNDEIWEILEVSEDGLWLKLDVPHLSEDGGWISAEYAFAAE